MTNCLIIRKGTAIEGIATASDVLSGVTFQSANSDDLQTGTMTNNGNVSVTLSAGDSYTIPWGFHSGSGKVAANAMDNQVIALFNNDSTSKQQSEVYSNVLTVDSTETIVNYYLFSYASTNGYDNSSAIQGSNDGSNWTSLYTLKLASHASQIFYSAVKGYKYYRLYSRCTGDNYGPRSATAGIASAGEISFTKGNN